ncbi:hypothetical protein AOLI_G00109770 [Acnodon oligacanthus]
MTSSDSFTTTDHLEVTITPEAPLISTTNTVLSSTTTQTTASTKSPLACENGGTPNPTQNNCLCPPGFTGRICNTVEAEIKPPDMIERSAIAEVGVNKEFLPEYEDTFSVEYQDFVTLFKNQMTPFYKANIRNFVDIINIILRVNVKHDIVVEVQNDVVADDYDEVLVQVEEAFTAVRDCSSSSAASIAYDNAAYADENYRQQSNSTQRSLSSAQPSFSPQQQIPSGSLHNNHPVRIKRPQIHGLLDV